MSIDLQALAAKAGQVSEVHSELSSAVDEEQKAQALLLTNVVEAVRPSLRALSSRIKASYRSFWVDNVSTDEEQEFFERTADGHRARGLAVAGDGCERLYPRANSGAYGGTRLWLLEDGTFAESTYSGTWSKWQGASSSWEATLVGVPIEQVVEEWSVETILAKISEALDKQLAGKAPERAKAARERAAKTRAIAELVKR